MVYRSCRRSSSDGDLPREHTQQSGLLVFLEWREKEKNNWELVFIESISDDDYPENNIFDWAVLGIWDKECGEDCAATISYCGD